MPVRERSGADLIREAITAPPLKSLPFIGQKGYVINEWSHLVSGYPRAGKTEVLGRCATESAPNGAEAVALTSRPR